MKLAEALQQRADLTRRIAQIANRLNQNAKKQEGTEPAEDPQELLEELRKCIGEECDLITRINLTNSRVRVEGETLTALLSRRDSLKKELDVLQSFCGEAGAVVDRYSAKEIRILSTVDVRALRKECDRLSAEFRRVDTAIQAANWRFDLK
ncbi:MAG: DIP1984 family protein [Clostridia bacterium]|nr:DIP1984 family protein [Clostridia bacterium]